MKLLKLVPDNTNIDFMRIRNIALVLSILVTVASLTLVGIRGLNLGVDFLGGQMVRVTFAKQVDVEQLRNDVGSLNLGEAGIQQSGGPTSFQIRLPKPEGGEAASNRAASQVRAMLGQKYPGSRVDSVETVSGKVSEELAWDGGLSITLAMIGIAIYIWFRFEWQFGVGALLTLFHDVSMTLGFFSLTQLQVDLNVVAAILTIVGYSLNETLSRTMVTSLSILLALGMLLLLGPDVIFGLTIAIFVGIFVGTYSSIYISSPVLVWLGVKPDSFVRSDEEQAPGPAAV